MLFIHKLTEEGALGEFLEHFDMTCQAIDEGEEIEEAGKRAYANLNLGAVQSANGVGQGLPLFESPKTSQIHGVKAP